MAFAAIPMCIAVHIHTDDDLDDDDRLDEDQFIEAFNLKKISDLVEKAIRAARLAKTEEEVRSQNEAYIDGESPFYSRNCRPRSGENSQGKNRRKRRF